MWWPWGGGGGGTVPNLRYVSKTAITAQKIFWVLLAVWGHDPPENFENGGSQMG